MTRPKDGGPNVKISDDIYSTPLVQQVKKVAMRKKENTRPKRKTRAQTVRTKNRKYVPQKRIKKLFFQARLRAIEDEVYQTPRKAVVTLAAS
jgi:hypothetical protein